MYCASQGRPANAATFILVNLNIIAQETQGTILIGGLVTMIADVIGLRYPLKHIHAFGSIRPMHLNFCFNYGIIANLGPAEFELLIDNQVVFKFTLPNHEKKMFTIEIIGFIIWRVKVSLPHHLTVLSLMKTEIPISLMLLHMSQVFIVLIL